MKSHPPIHLEIQRKGNRAYGILRSSFRDKEGKVCHSQHGRITGLSYEQLKLIQAAIRGDALPKDSPEALKLICSREFGGSKALLELAKAIGLPEALYSRKEWWVQSVLAMIIGGLLYAGSKLSLIHQQANTALWELCGVSEKVDVDKHCYQALDELLKRQQQIQKKLADKHLEHGQLVLYDITSSYLEGEYKDNALVQFGYNRDGKRGHKQIVIGLLCNAKGCPFGVEVFVGNTQDSQTVLEKVEEVREQYKIAEVVFVGDRGMITRANAKVLKTQQGLRTISALTHLEITELLKRGEIELNLFKENQVVEVIDSQDRSERYMFCCNPLMKRKEGATREALLASTIKELERIAGNKRKRKAEKIGATVGRVLKRYKTGKFIEWKVEQGHLQWSIKQEVIEKEAAIDGCYIVRSDVSPEVMSKEQVVSNYKNLQIVERAFRSLKTVHLELRPIYHHKEERIRAHVFLCMLAFYLQWHMEQRLEPLFKTNKEGKERRWTVRAVLERLQSIRTEKISMGEVQFEQITQPDDEQRYILELLGVSL